MSDGDGEGPKPQLRRPYPRQGAWMTAVYEQAVAHPQLFQLIAFAEDFAAGTCGGRYKMLSGDRLTTYAVRVLFRCT